MKHSSNEILEEIWAVRDAHAKKFNYDLTAIGRDVRSIEERLGPEWRRVSAPQRPGATPSHSGKTKP